jgi:type I restriction enzyme S subunit
MHLLKHFKELSVRPKNAHELKGLILQLAIQGKLTGKWRKENPDVEPASELFKQIKKEKLPTKISKENIPYKIPESWNWYNLVDLGSINGGFAFKSSDYIEDGVRVIRISDFDENGFKNHKIVRHLYSDTLEQYVLEDKNILIAMTGGTVGKSLFVDKVPEIMVVNQRVATIKIFKPIYEAYINCVIPTKLIQDVIEEAKNSTNDNISMSDIKGFKIPLPPLEEQKAIVEVVETLFKEVEQLEQLTVERISLKEDFVISALNQLTTNNTKQEWAFLQDHFQTFFNETTNIKKLRETVLQLAVQGKLTADWRTNNSNVEDASVLLKRIQKEKAQLIKDKKIKKEKPLPPISKDEIPYELPEGWEFVKLGNFLKIITDGSHFSPSTRDIGIPYITVRDIDWKGNIDLINCKKINQKSYLELVRSGCKPEINDVLFSKDGTVGKTFVVDIEDDFVVLSSLAILKPVSDSIDSYFLEILLQSPPILDQAIAKKSGSALRRIVLAKIKQLIIPIPSLEEQRAIVEKVNVLMILCDALEQHVQQSQEQSEQLMQSCLREVFN